MSNFKVGDLVVLKSGGPVMTVRALVLLGNKAQVDCQWFSGKKLESGRFAIDSLRESRPEEVEKSNK